MKDEGNAFTKSLQAARDNGDKEFSCGGKTYKVEEIDELEKEDEKEKEEK